MIKQTSKSASSLIHSPHQTPLRKHWILSLNRKLVVTRGRAGSPRRTGRSGSLLSPFRVLAACVCVRSEGRGCPSRAVRCGRAGAEWEERGGSGPGWPRGERAGVGRTDRLRPLLLLRPEGHVAAASSFRISTTLLPLRPYKIKARFTFVLSIKKWHIWMFMKSQWHFFFSFFKIKWR